jgi:hypothetical protein
LGFLLCIEKGGVSRERGQLSIPFIGIFALHLLLVSSRIVLFSNAFIVLSIPFIGIFALHQPLPSLKPKKFQ